MPNEILQKQGTNRTWQPSGGDELLTLTSLANAAGRKGDGHDWGAAFAVRHRISLETACGTSPTAGNTIEVYWASSHDNSDFDGSLAAGDGAVSDADILPQLHYVGALVVDNVTTVQRASWIFHMPARYGFPVVWNRSGQTLSATAGDHQLNITPLIDEVQ